MNERVDAARSWAQWLACHASERDGLLARLRNDARKVVCAKDVRTRKNAAARIEKTLACWESAERDTVEGQAALELRAWITAAGVGIGVATCPLPRDPRALYCAVRAILRARCNGRPAKKVTAHALAVAAAVAAARGASEIERSDYKAAVSGEDDAAVRSGEDDAAERAATRLKEKSIGVARTWLGTVSGVWRPDLPRKKG